jgi:hypothetical protein
MTLPNHVSNLILSQRLKELGVKQESLFWYVNFGKDEWHRRWEGEVFGLPGIEGLERVSAFLSSELGEMLPKGYGSWRMFSDKKDEKFGCGDVEDQLSDDHIEFADTEADARALCLIHLLETGIVKNI